MKTTRKRIDTAEHRYAEERLSAYLDGQLPPREHKAVRQHLTTCQECEWNLSTLRQTVQWARALPKVPVPRVFTIPAPSRPVSAPRWRWGFAPLLQGATALVALLLVFTLAGDFLLISLQPASAPQPAVMLEQAPAAVQVTAVVQEVEEALPPEEEAMAEPAAAAFQVTGVVREVEEALPAEEEAMDERAVSEPIPATTPQTGILDEEPALGEAEQLRSEADQVADAEGQAVEKAAVAAEAAPEAEEAQAMAVEPPRAKESEATTATEAVEASPTLPPEATAAEGAGAAGAGEPVTSTVIAALPPTEPPTVVAPTAVVQAQAATPMMPEGPGGIPAGVFQQPFSSPLRLVEVGLAVLVVFLGTLAIVATILQRRPR